MFSAPKTQFPGDQGCNCAIGAVGPVVRLLTKYKRDVAAESLLCPWNSTLQSPIERCFCSIEPIGATFEGLGSFNMRLFKAEMLTELGINRAVQNRKSLS